MAATFELNVTFLNTLFPQDLPRLSRPVAYIIHDFRSLSPAVREVELYLDATAQWAVNGEGQEVNWTQTADPPGVSLGTTSQDVLGRVGDQVSIDWGYLHLAPAVAESEESVTMWAGSAATSRAAFNHSGVAPHAPDNRKPRKVFDDLPALTLVASLGKVGSTAKRSTALLAYDDIKSVSYYGWGDFKGLWTRTWPSIQDAIRDAGNEVASVLETSQKIDDDLLRSVGSVGGEEYARISALAYRQAIAATKLVYNDEHDRAWNFLKEISTNGDMQTMDVIYPASPLFLYVNPELLKKMLLPVLAFANNETYDPYTYRFSPHEVGTYPVADHTTADQEVMPMENTGNMFLMLAGIVYHDPAQDTSFLEPYWTMLLDWADYLVDSLPFPADQLCTDDFTGRLANNTNLAAKGIVALEAFAALCETVGKEGNCTKYRDAARNFVPTWMEYAWEHDHFKIAYGFSNSYSIKYNMVWQKLLGLEGPFPWDEVVPVEVEYYLSKANEFGPPMDSRHTYVKTDWLSWAAAMAHNASSFQALQSPVYRQAQSTNCRVPMTDLMDTITAECSYGKLAFVDRPVIGGVFAKMVRIRAEELSWPAVVVV